MAAQTHSRGEKRHPDVCLVIQARGRTMILGTPYPLNVEFQQR